MSHGKLRVFLGAAPGVGKTYTMLEEGKRLHSEGRDVAVAIVETHGRKATATMAEGLELIPLRPVTYRGLTTHEMDVDAVIARHPDIALVDELAHTNAPGMRNPKRWQDVQEILNAGIDVMTTVNVQHVESLNDVVERITGVPQRETLPDEALRQADQIEVVDVAPAALRQRLSEGNVYPAERIDAALSNYFRLGNLTALRELALLWLADDVDATMRDYRADHKIDNQWETRERVVVALSGGPEGETLLRRGARIAARAGGGELLAVYVNTEDGLRHGKPGTLAAQRTLVEQLGGRYHQIVGNDVPSALIEFAKSQNATQLVIGISKHTRLRTLLDGPGISSAITRSAGSIDVHIVNHPGKTKRVILPIRVGGLTSARKVAAFVALVISLPVVTWALTFWATSDTLIEAVVAYQLLVIIIALIGGLWPALLAALASGLALDYFFITPIYTITIAEPSRLIVLLVTILNAALVSYVVDQAARRSRLAQRAEAESELLSTIAGSVLRGESALAALLTRSHEAFGLSGVRIVSAGRTVCEAGNYTDDDTADALNLGERGTLQFSGRVLSASERRLMGVIAAQAEAALEHADLQKAASEVGALTETDRVRSALLSAVSHDLRRPLAAATVAVSALRSPNANWSDTDRSDLLDTAQESLDTLATLVTNLLDTTRLQAGVLAMSLRPTTIDDVILPALDELSLGPDQVELDLDPDLPTVDVDQALLVRVVVNLLTNAENYNPPGSRIRVSTSRLGDTLEIRVMDHGPGIPDERKEKMFEPFQHRGDITKFGGLGLGLAIAKGFTEGMRGTLSAEDTPGGGLTMVVALPITGATAGGASASAADGAAENAASSSNSTSTSTSTSPTSTSLDQTTPVSPRPPLPPNGRPKPPEQLATAETTEAATPQREVPGA